MNAMMGPILNLGPEIYRYVEHKQFPFRMKGNYQLQMSPVSFKTRRQRKCSEKSIKYSKIYP
jgi:hypothetical protein